LSVAGIQRENLARRTLLALRSGSSSGPDVLLVEADGGRAVVKDVSSLPRWLRLTLGRWLLRREERAHLALADHPAVPRLLGRLDADAIVIEHRAGSRFSRRRPWTFGAAFAAQLERDVAAMHARGVVHGDLAHRSNLLADPSGRPVLIDFDAAVCFRPGGPGARFLLPWLAAWDRRAVRKWKRAAARTQQPRS
jgi:hypothetical protein